MSTKKIVPPTKPKQGENATRALLVAAGVTADVALVGVRGYYRDTMGEEGKNDRGIYDDAIFLVSPTAYASFNANTDPSVRRPGIATLKPGVHLYKKGKHGISRGPGYPALRPATPGEQLPVVRDGVTNPRPGVAINIHRGSINSTSSEGCQTIHPSQWAAFVSLVYAEMERHGAKRIPYLLIENQG